MSDEAAYVLFPDDAPTNRPAPDWFQQHVNQAEHRLSGNHGNQAAPAENGRPAGEDDDVAAALFSDEAKPDYERIVSAELDQYTLGAIQDGDEARAGALKAATSALAYDFHKAGTDAEELKEAFAIVRLSIGMVPPSLEQREASLAEGMAAIAEAGITDTDLNAARSFIRDLETVAPGVVASLEAHGAGNDPRLIKAAIREAKRRGYR